MPQKIFLVVCSLVFSSCAQISRPHSDLCLVNAPGKKLTCYWLDTDFNDAGQVKPDAKPHFKPAPDIEAVNKYVAIDPDSFVKLKAYIKKLREEYDSGCK